MIKVFIAESSAVLRSVIREVVSKTRHLTLIGDAASADEMLKKINSNIPDFIIASFNVFNENRIEPVLFKLKAMHIPSLLFVDDSMINAPVPSGIRLMKTPNALSFSLEDINNLAQKADSIALELGAEVRHAVQVEKTVPVKAPVTVQARKDYAMVLVGVSTGGPGTIHTLLNSIGPDFPLPILITQHIDSFFDKNLISWLNANCPIPVHLVEREEEPKKGNVYFAPSDFHLVVKINIEGRLVLSLNHDEPVNFFRPAVDKMFDSAVEALGSKCIGVLLTGMGADGAEGCCRIKNNGGYTITQSESSCVIYGMPKAAYDAGGSCEVLPLEAIADRLYELTGGRK